MHQIFTGISYVPSPDDCSASSSSDESGESSENSTRRQILNVFLQECGIEPLGKAWHACSEASERTRRRYLQQTSEIVSSVLRVISPEDYPDLWKALQSSLIVNDMLGVSRRTLPSEVAYLEALAEAYKREKSWDTRRQAYKLSKKQKEYLDAKFNLGQISGRKANPDVVAKELRRARDIGEEKLFSSSEFLTVQQVTLYLSRLAPKG